jgi:cytochrome c553
MKIKPMVFTLLAGVAAGNVHAAGNIDAGKAKVEEVCSACHGANGASVSDTIPNLAGQKGKYIEIQLKALRDGTRPHPIMGAIAKQLTDDDIANVAAYFSSLQGAAAAAKSDFMPNLAKSHESFPENYQHVFVKYLTMNFADNKQVRYYYANDVAIRAAKAGKPLPDGSVLFAEVFSAKLDADKKPVKGKDGFFEPEKLVFYTAMARDKGWGAEVPEMLRNENWNYAVFTLDKQQRAGVNQAECLACHKPHSDTSYVFTLKDLTEVAKSK